MRWLLLALLVGCVPASEIEARSTAVTNGASDGADPAVVALVDGSGRLVCTGTLIAPHTVLTAAHCMIDPVQFDGLRAFFGSSLAAGGTFADITDARQHPMFDPATSQNDLALVTIRQAGPGVPLPLDPRTIDASWVGLAFRTVGFGRTGPAATDEGDKRDGTATVTVTSANDFTTAPAPSQPCLGDSGSPALFTAGSMTYVSGVSSHGDTACADHAVYSRIDIAQGEFIAPYLAATAPGSVGIGDRCFYDDQCRTGSCLQAMDEPRLSFCSQPCRGPADCPAPLMCAADGCRYPQPSPGATGSSCTQVGQCLSELCYVPSATMTGTCTHRCSPTATDPCPAGFVCEQAQGIDFYCLAPPAPAAGCSCALARTEPRGASAFLAAALAWLVARRARGARNGHKVSPMS